MSEEEKVKFRKFLRAILSAAPSDVTPYATKELRLLLPSFPSETIKEICGHAYSIFSAEPVVLTLTSPFVVVGDIHGHILDLLRIINCYGLPDRTPYLFLGDIVDRGEFSIECILLVFLFKIIWSDRVFIIRGNHEFEFLCAQCGFLSQLVEEYPASNLMEAFLCAFSQMPLAAVVDGTVFCVHGGLGPKMSGLAQMGELQRPITGFGNDVLDSMLWSDPSADVEGFVPSNRGTGYLFGADAVRAFLVANKLKCIVRGHECVAEGCQRNFDGTCITVFSASNYCGLVGNESAVLEITGNGENVERRFPPLEYLRRGDAQFEHVRGIGSRRDGPRESQSVRMLPTLPGLHETAESAEGNLAGQRRSWGCATPFVGQRPRLSKLFGRSARKTNPVFAGPPKIKQSQSTFVGLF